jgi:hypothetical protein
MWIEEKEAAALMYMNARSFRQKVIGKEFLTDIHYTIVGRTHLYNKHDIDRLKFGNSSYFPNFTQIEKVVMDKDTREDRIEETLLRIARNQEEMVELLEKLVKNE